MRSIAIDDATETIYAVSAKYNIYKQAMRTMSPTSNWTLVAEKGDVHSIAIDRDTIYCAASDKMVYKQTLSTMTSKSDWSFAAKGSVTSIAIGGDSMYGVGPDHLVYKKALSSSGGWEKAGSGYVRSLAVDGDTVYGVGMSKRVWQQSVTSMSPSSQWSLAAAGDVLAVVLTSKADPGQTISLAAIGPVGHHKLSLGEIRLEMAKRAFSLMGATSEHKHKHKLANSKRSSSHQTDDKVSLAASADLSKEGYKAVASTCCPLEMSRFLNRLISHRGWRVCNEGSLQSLVAWYYCDKQSRTFSELTQETMKATEGDCAWIGTEDICPKMSKSCAHYPDTAGRRRACKQHPHK